MRRFHPRYIIDQRLSNDLCQWRGDNIETVAKKQIDKREVSYKGNTV